MRQSNSSVTVFEESALAFPLTSREESKFERLVCFEREKNLQRTVCSEAYGKYVGPLSQCHTSPCCGVSGGIRAHRKVNLCAATSPVFCVSNIPEGATSGLEADPIGCPVDWKGVEQSQRFKHHAGYLPLSSAGPLTRVCDNS
ncbi:UNVERIFIED_CONTAM: hypothetical protein FKN15_024481 [Acipenser sinensis]